MEKKPYVRIISTTDDVPGNNILLEVHLPYVVKRYVIDCGSYFSDQTKNLDDFCFDPKEIDAVFVTHAHIDHIGRIPYLYKMGFRKKIYMTQTTSKIFSEALNDNLRIQKSQMRRCPVSSRDIDSLAGHVEKAYYNKAIKLDENIKVTFLRNNHIFGSSMIWFEITDPMKEPIHLLFTGDLNLKSPFYGDVELPKELYEKKITIISESTYGGMHSDEIKKIFNDVVKDAVERRRLLIIPAFALGRSQRVLLELKRMQMFEEIPKVRVLGSAGLTQKYNEMIKSRDIEVDKNKNFLPSTFAYLSGSYSQIMRKLTMYDTSSIIVASSGNGNFGVSKQLITQNIDNEKATILFSGYCVEGTLGRELLDTSTDSRLEMCGISKEKKAEVYHCTEFSEHEKSDGLIGFMKRFPNLQSVLLTHGSKENKEKLAEKVKEELDLKTVTILNAGTVCYAGSWGVYNQSKVTLKKTW